MSEFIDNVAESARVSDLYEFARRVQDGAKADAIAPGRKTASKRSDGTLWSSSRRRC